MALFATLKVQAMPELFLSKTVFLTITPFFYYFSRIITKQCSISKTDLKEEY